MRHGISKFPITITICGDPPPTSSHKQTVRAGSRAQATPVATNMCMYINLAAELAAYQTCHHKCNCFEVFDILVDAVCRLYVDAFCTKLYAMLKSPPFFMSSYMQMTVRDKFMAQSLVHPDLCSSLALSHRSSNANNSPFQ